MWTLLLALAFADEPCYGVPEGQDVLEGEHFWVSWPPEVITEDVAQDVLAQAEEARSVYLDLGFGFTEDVVLVEITDGRAASGFAQTWTCEGRNVPRLQVEALDGVPSPNTVAHEVAHAAQYADMGHYLDAVASWVWWMEGSAVWMALQVDGDTGIWSWDAANYLRNPQLSLHHNLVAYAADDRRTHMYGTSWLAQYVDERHGGPNAVRSLWAWGGDHTGDPIDFREAVEAEIGPFEPFWAEYLARSTTAALEDGHFLNNRARGDRITELPASGEVSRPPEGYGFATVHFPEGETGKALQVEVELDPEVDWVVVLALTQGGLPGRPLLGYEQLEVVNGRADGHIEGFEPDVHGWLVVSPLAMDPLPTPREVSYSAATVDVADSLVAEPVACGCRSGSVSTGWLALLLPFLVRRSRSTSNGTPDHS